MTSKQLLDWRIRLYYGLESRPIQRLVISVIIVNAVLLGLETVPSINQPYGHLLYQLDRLCLLIFVGEAVPGNCCHGATRIFP